MIGSFFNTYLPGIIGGDGIKAYYLSRELKGAGTPAGEDEDIRKYGRSLSLNRLLAAENVLAVASVFMDRMLGVLSLLIMAVVGLIFARQMARDPLVLTALAVTALVCAATAAVVFSLRADAVVQRLAGWLPWARGRALAARLLSAVQVYATRHGDLANVLAGSIGVQVLRIIQAYFLGQALGIAQPLTTYAAFIPLILLVMLLPVTINGLGTSQLAFVWAFAQAGVPGAQSFPLSVLFVARGVVGNLPGSLLYASGGMHVRPSAGRPPS
jgi:hypothetical protein